MVSMCKKGCSYCCSQCIVVNSVEIAAIETYMRNLSKESIESIKQRTIHICKSLEEIGINNKRLVSCYTEIMQIELQEEYFSIECLEGCAG